MLRFVGSRSWAHVLAAAVLLAGCYSAVQDEQAAAPTESPTHPAAGPGGAAAGGGSGGGSGLPCDVREVLASKCQGCHGSTPSAPMALMTYEDLVAPAKSKPDLKVAELAVTRMKSDAAPMPPSGARAAVDQVNAVEQWVKRGMPREACGAVDGGGAAATPGPSPATGSGDASAATSCGSLDNPAWAAIFATHFGPGSPGHCASSGCHLTGANGGWSVGGSLTASSLLSAWIGRGLVSTSSPSSSLIASGSSPLVWFNPGGTMPLDNKTANPAAVTEIKAWLAAVSACDAGGGGGGGGSVTCPAGQVAVTLEATGPSTEEWVESRPAGLMLYVGAASTSACFAAGSTIELRATQDATWVGASCGLGARCQITAQAMHVAANLLK